MSLKKTAARLEDGKCEAAVEEETVEPQRKTGFCPDCGLPLMAEDDETIASMLVGAYEERAQQVMRQWLLPREPK